jgi:hypothetical protein
MSFNHQRRKNSIIINKHVNKQQNLPQTQDEFERLLNQLRPKASHIEVVYQHNQGKIGCLIYCDGELKHAIEPIHEDNGLFYEEHVLPIVTFYKNPPRLWPGCRGDIARACRHPITTQFNRWFDGLADQGKQKH